MPCDVYKVKATTKAVQHEFTSQSWIRDVTVRKKGDIEGAASGSCRRVLFGPCREFFSVATGLWRVYCLVVVWSALGAVALVAVLGSDTALRALADVMSSCIG